MRPFKTFLHTVQKNQLLMTPSSVGRNNVVKSFIKHNTPLRTDPKVRKEVLCLCLLDGRVGESQSSCWAARVSEFKNANDRALKHKLPG